MRIGLVIPTLHGGGAELVARRWLRGVVEQGHTVAVYLYSPNAVVSDDLAGLDITINRLPVHGYPQRVISVVPWLRRSFLRDNPDVVVSMITFSNLVTVAACLTLRGKRPAVIISERNLASTYLPLEGRSGRVQRVLARFLYRHADAAIALSHPVAADLVGAYGCNPEAVFVVPNGPIDDSVGAPAWPHRAVGQHLSEPGLRVLFVGRLVEQKRPYLFVDVLAELRRRGLPASGIVIGDGPMRESMAEGIKKIGLPCEFLGWREPWHAEASRADVLLLPSSVEGFGNVLVEAAAAGLPSVACSSALGVADALVPGVTGALSLSSSAADLADAVVAAATLGPLTTPAAWLGRFSSTESVRLFIRTLELVLAASRSSS